MAELGILRSMRGIHSEISQGMSVIERNEKMLLLRIKGENRLRKFDICT